MALAFSTSPLLLAKGAIYREMRGAVIRQYFRPPLKKDIHSFRSLPASI